MPESSESPLDSLIPCTHCNRLLIRRNAYIARHSTSYCDSACLRADYRTRFGGENNPRHGKHRGRMLSCKTCGSQFYIYPSELTKPGRTNQYCSNKCKGERTSEVMRGKVVPAEQRSRQSATMIAKNKPPDEHPSWRGGTCKLYGKNWGMQRKLTLERDAHACQDCGYTGKAGSLDIHHITPRRFFSDDWQAANDLANLVTLCKSCHSTREQSISAILRELDKDTLLKLHSLNGVQTWRIWPTVEQVSA